MNWQEKQTVQNLHKVKRDIGHHLEMLLWAWKELQLLSVVNFRGTETVGSLWRAMYLFIYFLKSFKQKNYWVSIIVHW